MARKFSFITFAKGLPDGKYEVWFVNGDYFKFQGLIRIKEPTYMLMDEGGLATARCNQEAFLQANPKIQFRLNGKIDIGSDKGGLTIIQKEGGHTVTAYIKHKPNKGPIWLSFAAGVAVGTGLIWLLW